MRIITLAFGLLLSLSFSALSQVSATPVKAKSQPKTVDVILETNMGKIELELNAELAPISVANFLQYVDSGFYNNTILTSSKPKITKKEKPKKHNSLWQKIKSKIKIN